MPTREDGYDEGIVPHTIEKPLGVRRNVGIGSRRSFAKLSPQRAEQQLHRPGESGDGKFSQERTTNLQGDFSRVTALS